MARRSGYPRRAAMAGWVALGTACLIFPFVSNDYWIFVANRALVTVIAAVGISLLSGSTGQISVGQGAFVAVGGYGAALAANELGLAIVPAVLVAVVGAVALGVVVGLPALRLDSLYLAVATLVFHVALLFGVRQLDLTGGSVGLRLPVSSVGGWWLDDRVDFYLLLLGVSAVSVASTARLLRSRTGRALMAIRDREVAAAALGVHVTRFRLFAFGMAAALGALAGSIDAFATRTITPDTYPLTLSIQLLTVIVVGGLGSLGGAVVSAVVLSYIPEGLRTLTSALDDVVPRLADQLLAVQTGVYGAVLVAVLVLQPEGLAGWMRRVRAGSRKGTVHAGRGAHLAREAP